MRKAIKINGLIIFLAIMMFHPPLYASNDQVYLVLSASCPPQNMRFAQTGFRTIVQNQIGLVTALHGVVGCGRVVAIQHEFNRPYIPDLQLTKISVAYDVAFFTSERLMQESGTPLKSTGDISATMLQVVGYPQGSNLQLDHPLEFFDSPKRTLSEQFGGSKTEYQLKQRNSPSVHVPVFLVRGVLQGGYSGAPVLTQSGTVVAVADGGLAQGYAQINWAIPFDDIPWVAYNENDPEVVELKSKNAANLFHNPWTGPSGLPQNGATVAGTIFYNGKPATNTTKAFAMIQLVEHDSWRALPIDYQYDNNTGRYSILDVPPGKYVPFVRLESGYPFHLESGGDYHARISGMNSDIVVAPHDRNLQINLEVVQGIHLKRPVDNQQRRTHVGDPPERLYPSFYAPSADVFEWDPVPGAASYHVHILTVRKAGEQPLNIIEKRLNQPRFVANLNVSPPGTHYMFRVEAFNASNKRVGTFNHYYKDGDGGWFEFVVIPKPN